MGRIYFQSVANDFLPAPLKIALSSVLSLGNPIHKSASSMKFQQEIKHFYSNVLQHVDGFFFFFSWNINHSKHCSEVQTRSDLTVWVRKVSGLKAIAQQTDRLAHGLPQRDPGDILWLAQPKAKQCPREQHTPSPHWGIDTRSCRDEHHASQLTAKSSSLQRAGAAEGCFGSGAVSFSSCC